MRLRSLQNADTLYDDGAISTVHGSWVLYSYVQVQDSFTLASDSVLTGVTFGNWVDKGTAALTVDWIIVGSEGSQTPACGSCFGTAALTVVASVPSQNGSDVYDEGFSLPNLDLNAGTYWLGLGNEITSNNDPGSWDINEGPSEAWHNILGDVTGPGCAGKIQTSATSCSSSFTILGSPVADTPEPDALVLLGSGLVFIGTRMRRRGMR